MVGSVYVSVCGGGAALKATVSVQDKDNDSLLSSSGRRGGRDGTVGRAILETELAGSSH